MIKLLPMEQTAVFNNNTIHVAAKHYRKYVHMWTNRSLFFFCFRLFFSSPPKFSNTKVTNKFFCTFLLYAYYIQGSHATSLATLNYPYQRQIPNHHTLNSILNYLCSHRTRVGCYPTHCLEVAHILAFSTGRSECCLLFQRQLCPVS